MRQGGQVEPEAVQQIHELVEPAVLHRVLKDQREADGLHGMGIDQPLLDPLLVAAPEAVQDEFAAVLLVDEAVDEGDEGLLGHGRPRLRDAKRGDDEYGQVRNDDVLEEALGFGALGRVHGRERDAEDGLEGFLGHERVLHPIGRRVADRLGRLGVLFEGEGGRQAGDGGRVQLLRRQASICAYEGELGLGIVPVSAP